MKILIIGYSGSGKSTLAQNLAAKLSIPVLHLDSVHFYGDWQERSVEEQSDIVRDFMAQNDSWIIDGNYSSVATERFEISDITVFLNVNRFSCFFAAWTRYRKHKGKCRADLPCTEKFDRSFRRWVLFKGRTRARKKHLMQILNRTAGRKVVLKNRRQVARFVNEIKNTVTLANN